MVHCVQYIGRMSHTMNDCFNTMHACDLQRVDSVVKYTVKYDASVREMANILKQISGR